ncbi:unnamed protein product [Caenorhabditis sp. 36 PRJEB53466]|nr:unnamed protein product [Caenorhabditis sp. 36 PRJEB53466]
MASPRRVLRLRPLCVQKRSEGMVPLLQLIRMIKNLAGVSIPSETSDDFSQALEFSYLKPDDVVAKLKREKTLWWEQFVNFN